MAKFPATSIRTHSWDLTTVHVTPDFSDILGDSVFIVSIRLIPRSGTIMFAGKSDDTAIQLPTNGISLDVEYSKCATPKRFVVYADTTGVLDAVIGIKTRG